MKQKTLERRLELLKLEGVGFSQAEIVKELAAKFQCSRRMVYVDFTDKPKWQPQLQLLKTSFLTILNRHEQIYRKAAFQYLAGKDDRAKMNALSIMRAVNQDYFGMLQSTGYIQRVSEKVDMNIELSRTLAEYATALENASRQNLRANNTEQPLDTAQTDS